MARECMGILVVSGDLIGGCALSAPGRKLRECMVRFLVCARQCPQRSFTVSSWLSATWGRR
eukprot:609644-Pyramimonas_sp.AAC.1